MPLNFNIPVRRRKVKSSAAQMPLIEPQVDGARDIKGSVPRTQDLICIAGVREQCLILDTLDVVGAVGFGSLDDTLLTDDDIEEKQKLYYELLITLRFPVQFLITTRPQDMTSYYDDVLHARDQHVMTEAKVQTFARRIQEYVCATSLIGEQGFRAFFGWSPNELIGTPGEARRVAWQLCDASFLAKLRGRADTTKLTQDLDRLIAAAISTAGWLKRWRRILVEQVDAVNNNILQAQSPVRRFYFVVSHNPRIRSMLLPTSGHLGDDEFQRARQRVDEYCRQIEVGIAAMDLPVWRVGHDDLLLDVRSFFNPSQGLMAGRHLRLAQGQDANPYLEERDDATAFQLAQTQR